MANRIHGRAVLAAITALALLGALLLVIRTPALAEDQDNDLYPEVWCGTGDTREEAWHWVHNQVPDGVTSATLTAEFLVLTGPDLGETIEVQVQGEIGTNIHYDFYYPEGLKLLPTPYDDVDGGKLVLSHWPDCPYGTTSTSSHLTTTTGGYQTTTTGGYQTTTTGGYTTTTEGQSTTTEGQSTTTEGQSTTTEGQSTTTEGQSTTTEDIGNTSTTSGGETTSTEGKENTSTSIKDEVSPTKVTTTTAPEVLPFTGISTGTLVMWAALLLITGLLVLVGVGGAEERGES